MINKKTMWKIITVTMVALAVSILITAVGGAFTLAHEMFPDAFSFMDKWFSSENNEEDSGEDTKAPVIKAAKENIIIYTGDTVSYRSFIKVTDNSDGECQISIDSSGVNQNVPGEYVVKYTATDAAGNKSKTFSLKVTVKDGTYSEENLMALIAQKAKTELGYTKEEAKSQGKTKTEIVKDIYKFVNDPKSGASNANIFFNDISNTPAQAIQTNYGENNVKERTGWKTDWVEEAYRTLTMPRMKGDCYSFYAVSKAFFEYFEIDNAGIQRDSSSTEKGTHYWNIVKVESGWYYYDSTRLGGTFADGGRNGCLVTESKLQGYTTSKGGKEFYKINKTDTDFFEAEDNGGVFPKTETTKLG